MSSSPRHSAKVCSIHEELRRQILAREWKVGDRLPTEAELAERFDCSPGTINKAAALLVHEGFLERGPRTGMRVLRDSAKPIGVQLDAVAYIYPSELHEGIYRMVRGMQEAAHKRGRRVITLTTGTDYQKESEFIGRLTEFDVKGAVVTPLISSLEVQLHFSQMMLNPKMPVVLAGNNLPGLGCSGVQADNFHAGYTMTRHLLDKGLRKIGFFSNHAWAQFMRDRYYGYRWALREAGVPENSAWVYLEDAMRIDFSTPLSEPTELARNYLVNAKGIEGVVCADDFLAYGMLQAAREKNLRVPTDLRVTGIDDWLNIPRADEMPLTTYHVPYEKIGESAFDLLEAQLAGERTKPVERLISGHLIERASTG